jgi:hypothetical protein
MNKYIVLAILLLAATLCSGQWLINENFDNLTTLPAGWITQDDGDGMIWRNLNNATHAYSGTRAAFVDNYLPNQNADWMITPQLAIIPGDSLIFYTRAWVSTENLGVYVSTTGPAVSNFTTQIMNVQGIGTTYQRQAYNLSAYSGQNIYIGFLWHCSTYGILVDDIKIGQPLIIQPEIDLPDTLTFYQEEELTLDVTPYITCTEINTASLTVSGNTNVAVTINGLVIHLSANTFNGSENLVFTLHDGSSGLSASDTVLVQVLPPPVVDLVVASIISPREFEYRDHAFTPKATVINNGAAAYTSEIGLSCTITDSSNVVQYSVSAFQTADLAVDSSLAVTLPSAFTPVTEGVYTLVFQLLTADDNNTNDALTRTFNVVYRVTQGGPDAMSYSFIDSNAEAGPGFNWIDISSTGSSSIMYGVTSWQGDDNFSEPVPIGFNFPFYGNSYSEMYIDINGEILLDGSNPWYEEYPSSGWDGDGNMFNYMYPLPGYTQMPALISVYWDDLMADQNTGNIYFQTFGTTPNRYCIIQWNNLRFLAGTGGTPQLKFQAILYENGEILMQYLTTQTGQSGSVVPHQNGRSATVGIQNAAANVGLCYLREIVQNNNYMGVEPSGNLLHDDLAIRFYNGVDNQAPVLTHTVQGNTLNLSPQIKVNAIDLSEIESVVLHYRYSGTWQILNNITVSGHDYIFQLPELPSGGTLEYYFSASDIHDNSCLLPAEAPAETYSFTILPRANTEVLLAYSGRQDYTHSELSAYQDVMFSIGQNYDTYNWEEYDSYRFPEQYKAILCYASVGSQGARSDTLSYALMQYLDSGTEQNPKNLFFSSDGWASSQGGSPNSSPMKKLFNAYFRSYYVATGLGGGTNGLAGPESMGYSSGSILCLTSSPVGVPVSEYQIYANSPDCIFRYETCPDWYADEVQYPSIGATNAFAFEDGPFDGQAYLYHGVCATSITLPIYKALYFSYDFSQLNVADESYEIMHDLLDWFGVLDTGNNETQIPDIETGISGNYPNPFNSKTNISFELSKKTQVAFTIYNIKGQKVKTYKNEAMVKGSHQLVWDGTDDKGDHCASSTYIIQMRTPDHTYNRKIMLIK